MRSDALALLHHDSDAVLREEQIKLARTTYNLLWPVIRGYQRRVAEDPHGELRVSPQELRVFLSAMKEAREAASFGTQREDLGEDAALELCVEAHPLASLLVGANAGIADESRRTPAGLPGPADQRLPPLLAGHLEAWPRAAADL